MLCIGTFKLVLYLVIVKQQAAKEHVGAMQGRLDFSALGTEVPIAEH